MSTSMRLSDIKNHEVYYTEGKFRLVRWHYGTSLQHTYIEHACPTKHSRTIGENDDWTGFIYNWQLRGMPCTLCDTHMSEGLQALFWIMKTEGAPSS